MAYNASAPNGASDALHEGILDTTDADALPEEESTWNQFEGENLQLTPADQLLDDEFTRKQFRAIIPVNCVLLGLSLTLQICALLCSEDGAWELPLFYINLTCHTLALMCHFHCMRISDEQRAFRTFVLLNELLVGIICCVTVPTLRWRPFLAPSPWTIVVLAFNFWLVGLATNLLTFPAVSRGRICCAFGLSSLLAYPEAGALILLGALLAGELVGSSCNRALRAMFLADAQRRENDKEELTQMLREATVHSTNLEMARREQLLADSKASLSKRLGKSRRPQ